MSALFGLISKTEKLEEKDVKTLIESLAYRADSRFTYVTEGSKPTELSSLGNIEIKGNTFIGHMHSEKENTITGFGSSYIGICGSVYAEGKNITPKVKTKEELLNADGEFYAVCLGDSGLTLVRDRLGTKSVFYGTNGKHFLFAPERAVFKKFQIDETPLPPDAVLHHSGKKLKLETARPIIPEKIHNEQKLEKALINSVKARLGNSSIAIMFSGGLDSSVMATLASRFSRNIELITIGTETAQDLEYAESVAKELNIDNFSITVLDIEDIRQALAEVGTYIPGEILSLALAVPLHICCKIARKRNINVIWNGQGAEELFAGYARYHRALVENKDVASTTLNDLKELYKRDLERNDLVAARNSTNGSYPFLDYDVVRNAIAFPMSMKLSLNDERKIILRKIAKQLGVPKLAYERPKKAVQYSTGIHKLIEKILKNSPKKP